MRALIFTLVIALAAMVAAIALAVRPHGNEVRLYHAAGSMPRDPRKAGRARMAPRACLAEPLTQCADIGADTRGIYTVIAPTLPAG
jgi:hypothetical protein